MNRCNCVACQQDRATLTLGPCAMLERDRAPELPLVHLDRHSLPTDNIYEEITLNILEATNKELRTISISLSPKRDAFIILSSKKLAITCVPFEPTSSDIRTAFIHTLKLARILDIARQLR